MTPFSSRFNNMTSPKKSERQGALFATKKNQDDSLNTEIANTSKLSNY